MITTNGYEYQIDKKDLRLVSQFTWTKPSDGYVKCYREKTIDGKRNRKVFLLHRLITGAKKGELVDHINNDPMDNRRSNLRITTKSVNALNTNKIRGNTPFQGVMFNKQFGKYQAKITINKKSYHLGVFNNPEDASVAYQLRKKEVLSNVI